MKDGKNIKMDEIIIEKTIQCSRLEKLTTNEHDELKKRIKNHIIKTHGNFYPDELSEKLDINFNTTMSILNELIKEEFIEVVE